MVSDNDILVRKPYPVHLPKMHKGIFLKKREREREIRMLIPRKL